MANALISPYATSAGAYFGRAAIAAGGAAASSAAGAAIKGEPVGKAALMGAGMSFGLATANFAVGKWSGWSKVNECKKIAKTSHADVLAKGEVNVGVNGIWNKNPVATGADSFSKGMDVHLFNPSHGGLQDLVECAQEMLFGPSTFSRGMAQYVAGLQGQGLIVNITSHSQGTIMATRALQIMGGQGVSLGGVATFNNPPMDPIQAFTAGWSTGMKVDYNANWLDPVSAIGSIYMMPTALGLLPLSMAMGWDVHNTRDASGYRNNN